MIHWISPEDPPDSFPEPATALRHPDGLLAAGGDLSPERLLVAYARGIFPWYEEGQPILWWAPDPRAVLFPDELRLSRSLRRTLRRRSFTHTLDAAFAEVVAGCAELRPKQEGTWITADMLEAYCRLHRSGHAHSVEVWQQDKLAGGIYGLALGKVFFGESMFSGARDASKVALVRLVEELRERGFALIDCQIGSAHLETLGVRSIPRRHFTQLLEQHCRPLGPTGPWARSSR